jgi:hypothetical protein
MSAMRRQSSTARFSLSRGPVAAAGVVGIMLVWLWPIGIGGMMPVGGDVTQFFLGLMGAFSAAIKNGRLPVWNDLWGYGFPGIGESQMGVYYPPHLLLYGLLSTEQAYVASLVLHTLWAGWAPGGRPGGSESRISGRCWPASPSPHLVSL